MSNQPNAPAPMEQDSRAHFSQVKRVLWQILGLNLVVAAAKIGVGVATGSISMIADGFHSTLDGSSNIIGLVGISIAARPPDESHPYGHQKYEAFATLGIGALLLIASWNVLRSAITRLIEGGAPQVTGLSFGVMLGSILISWLVTRYEGRQGQKLNSTILLADAAHTRSDIFVSLSVLIGLVAVRLGWPWVDAVAALLIMGFIAHTGWKIIKQASDTLADSAVIDTRDVEKVTLSVEGVESCHKIRSRGADGATYLDLHIQVNGQLSLEEGHELGHEVQNRLQEKLGVSDVIVHVEPAEVKPNTITPE